MTNTSDSASAQKPLELVPPEYFNRLIARMERSGYKLLSRVTVNSKDCAFHVEVGYARETALFFYLPNKQLIIHFVFREHDNPFWHEPSQYWTIRFCAVFKSMRRLMEMTYKPIGKRDFWNYWDPIEQFPLYEKPLCIPGFRAYDGYKYEQENAHVEPINPVILATTIVQQVYPALKYIGYGKFQQLQVKDFWPHSTFRRSYKIFWSRFNFEALKEIVQSPWDGDSTTH